MHPVKVVTLDAAAPYERGIQYGQQAKAEIDNAVKFYKAKFDVKPGWDRIIEFSRKNFIPAGQDFYPDLVEEIRGIADGSDHDIGEIMAVNCRYELSQFGWKPECTTGVFMGGVGGKNFIFKNCDLGRNVQDHLLILHIKRPDGYRAIGITEAGQLVRDGYNSYGIGLVNSAMMSVKDHAGMAVPGTFVRKKVWESKSFEEACAVQRGLYRTVSTNMLIADRKGNAIDFECYPGGENEITPVDGMIGTGNLFTLRTELERNDYGGIDRGLRLKELLHQHRDHITAETIMEILKDHEGLPLSICRHEEPHNATVYSIIVNMTDDRVYICIGNPCENEYVEYTL